MPLKKYDYGYTKSKDKLAKQLISQIGLCGKAFSKIYNNKANNFDENQENKIKFDFKSDIKNRYDYHYNKYYKINNIKESYDIKNNINNAIIKTKLEFPLLFCNKCYSYSKYRIEIKTSSIICRKCNSLKTNEWIKQKRKNDDIFRFTNNTRTLIYNALRNQGYSKKSKTHEILGCDFDLFKIHIENQFKSGMNWANYGKWHLDHIYPISKATSYEMALTLNHYTNFQPLWASENIIKRDKIINYQIKMAI
jgi:hypothetical protein